MPGCGNSDLSEKIVTKLSVDNIKVESFDYEETVVKKMQDSRGDDLKEKLNFSFGDATKLTYEPQSFDVAVDKGTLDAIAVSNDQETIDTCWAYFNEILKVLNKDGTLIIISLLQPHVYKIILDFFIQENEKNTHQKENLF